MKKNFVRRAAGILAVLIMLLTVTGCGSIKTDPVDRIFGGMEECDVDLFLSAFPEEIIEATKEQGADEYFETMLESLKEEFGDFTITYEIIHEEEVADLDQLRDMLEYSDMDAEELQEAWELQVEATVRTAEEQYNESYSFIVFLYDGGWYLDPSSLF